MLAILRDAQRRPDLFHWFGPIDRVQIQSWLTGSGFLIPTDLLELWSQTGGGDLFESETIFRPTSIPSSTSYFVDGDDVKSANLQRAKEGMPGSYLAFHAGTFVSAVRLQDRVLVTLNANYEEIATYATVDECYLSSLRIEFASRYELMPEPQ
jgi:hypothetical protein